MKQPKTQREKQKKRPAGGNASDGVEIPTRKISETLLDFAEPMWETVPDDVEPEQLAKLLILPITIWNSIVFEELGEMPGAVAKARIHVVRRGATPFMLALFDALVERKRRHFRDDYRLIGRHRVRRAPDGSLGVEVVAHWRGRPAASKDTRS